MTIVQWLSFRGRIGRKTYWLAYFLPLVVISTSVNVLESMLGVPVDLGTQLADLVKAAPISTAVWLLFLWPWMAASVKRLHDRDRSGWMIAAYYLFIITYSGFLGLAATMIEKPSGAIAIVMIVGFLLAMIISIWLLIEIGFLRGTSGPNQFGPDPLGGSWSQQRQPGMAQSYWQQQSAPPQWQPPSGYGQNPPGSGQQGPWPGPGTGGSVPPARRD